MVGVSGCGHGLVGSACRCAVFTHPRPPAAAARCTRGRKPTQREGKQREAASAWAAGGGHHALADQRAWVWLGNALSGCAELETTALQRSTDPAGAATSRRETRR